MLSTLSSFLPPSLQLGGGSQDKALRPNVEDISSPQQHGHPAQTESPMRLEHDTEVSAKSPGVDEHGSRKKKERTHESFIVVRPPPSKSNHPLNLQVQLVPPSSRAALPRASFSSGTSPAPVSPDPSSASGASDSPLTRTSSNRSDVSTYSTYTSFSTASTSSFSSVASTSTNSTSGGGRRMIIPLYNLQAHNVMTNVIVDAGTDAKIAKFQKRGLEVIGLAMLEVIETVKGASWMSDDKHAQGQGHQALLTTDGHTPTSSHVSLNSNATQESPPLSQHHPHQSPPLTPQHTPQPAEKSGARRLFGKVFRKKGDANNGSPQPNSPYLHSPSSNRSPLPSMDRDASVSTTPKAQNKRSSLLLASSAHAQSPSLSDQQASPALAAQQQQTVLGIQPTIYGGVAVAGPEGVRFRPTRYVWVVRKWLKGPPTGVTLPVGGLMSGHSVIDSLLEISFEWTRASLSRPHGRSKAKDKDTKEGRGKRRSGTGLSSNTPSLSSLKKASGRSSESRGRRSSELDPEAGRQDRRTRSPASVHTNTTATTEDGSPRRRAERDEDDEDEDEDSDPEDSETPWTCQLVVRKMHGATARRLSHVSDDGRVSPVPVSTGDVKVKVAAIVPAPHHPKVVSLLKVPFPLPDIIISSKPSSHPLAHSPHLHPQLSLRPTHNREVEIEVEARKRIVTPSGVARPAVIGSSGSGSPPATPTQAAVNSGSASAGLNKLAGKFKSTLGPALSSTGGHASNSSTEGGAVHHSGEGILLTAEEIKDLVCCTACWVIVREGFGGVGKVSRKGDGWRIRG